MSSSKARASRDHSFFILFFVSDLHEFWRSVMTLMSICLFTEVAMGYLSTGMGDRFGAVLVSLVTLRLMLVDRNPFRPCFSGEWIYYF